MHVSINARLPWYHVRSCYVHFPVHIVICIRVCACVRVCVCACVRVCVCACVRMCFVYVRACVDLCMCVRV
jgi:hypothetical protein